MFQLSGDGVRAAVDDVRVIDGECPLDRSQWAARTCQLIGFGHSIPSPRLGALSPA